jgi:hypothetical protein
MSLRNTWLNLIKNRDRKELINFISLHTPYKVTQFKTSTYSLQDCILLKKDSNSFHYINEEGLVYENGILPGDHRYLWDIKDYNKFFS